MKNFLLLWSLAVVTAQPVKFPDFVQINTKFASSVYNVVAAQNEDNFLVSPLSAQLVLALSQSGAEDETAEEMQNALKLPPNKDLVDCIMNNLVQTLQEERDYSLHSVNKIYIKNNFTIREDFRRLAETVYQTQIETIDFVKKNEAASTINQWVEKETNNKIHNLVDSELLGNETRTILLNALRFRANWSIPFQFFSTFKEDFNTGGTTIKVDMMHIQEELLDFYEKPHLNATFLELPIVGGNASMTVVLPNSHTGLPLLEEHIDEVLEAPKIKQQEKFNVALPKFKIESRIDFKGVMQDLGVKKAFEEGEADFSKIAGEKGELFIADVVQKTFVEVNEDGIEAAAATFVVKIVNRNAESPMEFIVNRPFLFFIKVDDLVLFTGRVVVPKY